MLGVSTEIADLDFETYSPAGYVWDPVRARYVAPAGASVLGLPAVGAAVYSEHPDAEVLSLAYNLKDGTGAHLWRPGDPSPDALLAHVANGGLLEAWNCAFERWIWNNICTRKYGWAPLPARCLRDAAAKARAFGLPGRLADAGAALGAVTQKDKDGTRLIRKFCIPRAPTLKNASHRILLLDDPADADNLYRYNLRDIEAEAEISRVTPDLTPSELEFWHCDQAINGRGVQLDRQAISACIAVINAAQLKYTAELVTLTDGAVTSISQVARLRTWAEGKGVASTSLDAVAVSELLAGTSLPPEVRRALEIRELIGSAAVKKLFAMQNTLTRSGRVHDLFIYHGARTGRAAGEGVQPQNLPNRGMEVSRCLHCSRHFSTKIPDCPWCGVRGGGGHYVEWNPEAVRDVLEVVSTRSLECVQYYFDDATAAVSGCLRGLFISKPGCDLVCSDYRAIEAVVLAALAGEQWRLDVFNTHGMIYETSAARILGKSLDVYTAHKAATGTHHQDRKLGKLAELASGFSGWIGAWKAFGADESMSDDQIKQAILAWRAASPAIVEFWGGQPNWRNSTYFGLEGAAVQAVLTPGVSYNCRGIHYLKHGAHLYCRLLSGRYLTYHNVQLSPSERNPGTYSLSFDGWNTNPKYGARGWVRMFTYAGKLTENVVQATARDILSHAIVNLEAAGYPVVLHVHDEIVSEVPEGFGSVAELERIMATVPSWANGWPVHAAGGWRAKRYRK